MPNCPHCGQPMPELEDETERARKRYRSWSRDALLRERERQEQGIREVEASIANPPKSWSKKTLRSLPGVMEYSRACIGVIEEILALSERTEAA